MTPPVVGKPEGGTIVTVAPALTLPPLGTNVGTPHGAICVSGPASSGIPLSGIPVSVESPWSPCTSGPPPPSLLVTSLPESMGGAGEFVSPPQPVIASPPVIAANARDAKTIKLPNRLAFKKRGMSRTPGWMYFGSGRSIAYLCRHSIETGARTTEGVDARASGTDVDPR